MARSKYPSDLADAFSLRFPDGMRGQLKDRAKANCRSTNGEIIAILAQALGNQGTTTTGQSFQAHPAVVSEQTALAGGALSTQASGEPK